MICPSKPIPVSTELTSVVYFVSQKITAVKNSVAKIKLNLTRRVSSDSSPFTWYYRVLTRLFRRRLRTVQALSRSYWMKSLRPDMGNKLDITSQDIYLVRYRNTPTRRRFYQMITQIYRWMKTRSAAVQTVRVIMLQQLRPCWHLYLLAARPAYRRYLLAPVEVTSWLYICDSHVDSAFIVKNIHRNPALLVALEVFVIPYNKGF